MKTFLVSLLLVASAACAGMGAKAPEPTPSEIAIEVTQPAPPIVIIETVEAAPLPVKAETKPEVKPPAKEVATKKIKISLELKGFSASQAKRLSKIKDAVEKIVNSEKFKALVIDYHVKGKRKFNENEGNNESVHERLTAKDWDVKIEYKSGSRGVLGWTYPSTQWVWFNSKYFDGREDSGLAGTFCHEIAHKFKFGHAYKNYRGREFTVPYGVGTICSQLYSKVL